MMLLRTCLLLAHVLWSVLVLTPDQRPSIRMPGYQYREGGSCTKPGCAGRLKWNSQGQLQCNKCFSTFVRAD
jgi:hypothetical protein